MKNPENRSAAPEVEDGATCEYGFPAILLDRDAGGKRQVSAVPAERATAAEWVRVEEDLAELADVLWQRARDFAASARNGCLNGHRNTKSVTRCARYKAEAQAAWKAAWDDALADGYERLMRVRDLLARLKPAVIRDAEEVAHARK